MVGLTSGHGHGHAFLHACCSHRSKAQNQQEQQEKQPWRLHLLRFSPNSSASLLLRSRNSSLLYSRSALEPAPMSQSSCLSLNLQRKRLCPGHGNLVRNASGADDLPVLALQGEDRMENISGSSDQDQVLTSPCLRKSGADIISDTNVNKTLTNSDSSEKERSNGNFEKAEMSSTARKPGNSGQEFTSKVGIEDYKTPVQNLSEDGKMLSSQLSSTKMKHDSNSLNNNDRNSTSIPLEIPVENLCEDGKMFSSSQRSSSKMELDSRLSTMLPSEMSKGQYEDRILLSSKVSTSKRNLDCNNLNQNGIKSTTMISSDITDNLGEYGKVSSSQISSSKMEFNSNNGNQNRSSTMIKSDMSENLYEDTKALLSQISTSKVKLDCNNVNENGRNSTIILSKMSEDLSEDVKTSLVKQKLDSNNADQNGIKYTGEIPLEMSEDSSGELSTFYSATDESESTLAYLLASTNPIEFITRFPAWADAQKESGMPQRQKRAFFSHEDWLQHRSTLRYVRHMLSSFSSRVIVSLVPPVFTFTVCAVVIAAYNSAVDSDFIPSFFPLLHASSLPYELTAPALALLLVFRTDASYSRYDEARKTWTNVISVTKDFARQSAHLIARPEDEDLKSSLLSYILAFPVALKCHLINGSDIRKELQVLLEKDDLAFVLASKNRPNCLLQLMSRVLALVQLENTERILLEANIVQYNASICVCERLIRTPIPLSYTRLTSRFLVLWHTSLPIVLWDSCNWLVVPATFLSSAMLFYIEEVGVLIEEPFPMLALDKIIGVAHKNIHELIGLQQKADEFLSLKRKVASDRSANDLTD